MSLASIEARALALMGMHKGDLSTALAKAEHALAALGHDIASLFEDEPSDDLAAAMGQGSNPDVADVPAASSEPEVLDEHGQWVPSPTSSDPVMNHGEASGEQQAPEPAAGEPQPVDVPATAIDDADAAPAAVVEGDDAAPADEPTKDAAQ